MSNEPLSPHEKIRRFYIEAGEPGTAGCTP